MQFPQSGDLFLDKYRIRERLGAGGFAEVFEGIDGAGRHVAIKLLTPDQGQGYSRELVARFMREARTLGMLQDPHTVTMFDSGQSSEGFFYMVFELVPGRDLTEVLDELGRLPASVAVHIMRQVLASLREAHQHGLLHRDIKPANIRVFEAHGDAWSTKLLDFGIATHHGAGDHTRITKTGQLIGTPRYMSPEQLLDQTLTPSSDIYSLGLVMLEMLMGREALGGNEWSDQIARLRDGHTFSVPQIEHIGQGLFSVLLRMTDRESTRRFASADAVFLALDDIARGVDHSGVRPIPASTQSQPLLTRPAQDNRLTMVLIAVVVLAVVLGGVVISLVNRTEAPARVPPRPAARLPSSLVRTTESPQQPSVAIVADVGVDQGNGRCAPAPGEFGMISRSAEIDFARHRWREYVPQSYDGSKPVPVVMLFHPDHIKPDLFIEQTRFNLLADRYGFLVFAPTVGERGAWGNPEHALAAIAMFQEFKADYCVDEDRIFAVGHNNAGKAVDRLSCHDWVRAVATNSYRPNSRGFLCTPARPVPTLTLNPLHTGHMSVEGGNNCYGSPKISLETFDGLWRERNACNGSAKPYLTHETSVCTTWDCESSFVSCHVDGGLGWPGSPPRPFSDWKQCDGTPPDFPTEEVIWSFFEKVAGSSTR